MNETFTNQTAGTQTPVDTYIRRLIADLKAPTPKNRWEELPPAEGRTKPQYRLQDADGNIATLTCDTEKKTHSQYTLRVTDAEEHPLMRSMEWQAAGCPSELGTLYALLQNRCHAVEPEKVETGGRYATPEQTDCFIRALVRDAKMPRPMLSWKREHHDDKVGYYSSGLSKSGSSIWLQQDHLDGDSDSYTLQYVRDGEMLLHCTETASLTENPDCMLRELYHLISKQDPQNYEVEVSAPEIRRFIAETESREMLGRICKNYEEKESGCYRAKVWAKNGYGESIIQQAVAAVKANKGIPSFIVQTVRKEKLVEKVSPPMLARSSVPSTCAISVWPALRI